MPFISNFNLLSSTADYLLVSNLFSFVFCIVMVAYMIFSLGSQEGSHTRHEFLKFMFFVIFCLTADMLSYVFDMQSFPGARILSHISMFLSVLFTAIVGTKWLFFFDLIFHINDHKRRRACMHIPPSDRACYNYACSQFVYRLYL